jgi:hypothetical protein
LPRSGRVRLTIDWTSEGRQHLLAISLVVGRRAVPLFWRAYDQRVRTGSRRRDELAVVKRACKLICGPISRRRIRPMADRGFADDELFDLLQALRIRFVIRVKGCVNRVVAPCSELRWGHRHDVTLGRLTRDFRNETNQRP